MHLMTRMQRIRAKRNARHRKRLDAAAQTVRDIAKQHGLDVGFFGSYARGSTGPRSDLDILVLGRESSNDTRAFMRDVERTFVDRNLDMDIVFEKDMDRRPMDVVR
ncbi:MAG: hypothetical protein F4213_18950 [Boseongicola sp. SB0677_bin_26]|nr:hypothetical protein [Boseongicola sp. SB0665_bin_10]MYG28069.1 hypothetical protein [Boseongicola sp. SB0677_bin_26]